jgi:hypothetical protein
VLDDMPHKGDTPTLAHFRFSATHIRDFFIHASRTSPVEFGM